MDESLRTTNLGYAVPSVEQRNRVLRNTYWLLALSMVPTVLGAWLGVATGIVATMGVGMSFIVFMVFSPSGAASLRGEDPQCNGEANTK